MYAYNPQSMQRLVPTPLVSVGQLQQGMNQQAQNFQNIGTGLENLARTKNEALINKLANNLDFTDSQAVKRRLAPYLGFTTQENRQDIATRLRDAAADQSRASAIGLQGAQKDLTQARTKTEDALRGKKLEDLGAKIGLTKAQTNRMNTLTPLEKERLIRSNEGQSLKNLLTLNQDQRADKQLKMQQEQWDMQKKAAEAKLGKEGAMAAAQAELYKTMFDPTATEEQKAIAKAKYDFMSSGDSSAFDKKQTAADKASAKRMEQKVASEGKGTVADDYVDKFTEGFNKAEGNFFDRPLESQTGTLVREALMLMMSDPAYSNVLNSGDPMTIYQAVKDYLGNRGQSIETEYDPSWSPSTWIKPSIKVKEIPSKKKTSR